MFVSGIFNFLFHLHTITPKCTHTYYKNLSKRQLFVLVKNREFHLFREPEHPKNPH